MSEFLAMSDVEILCWVALTYVCGDVIWLAFIAIKQRRESRAEARKTAAVANDNVISFRRPE